MRRPRRPTQAAGRAGSRSRAVTRLGAGLDDAASRSGLRPRRRGVLTSDDTAWVDAGRAPVLRRRAARLGRCLGAGDRRPRRSPTTRPSACTPARPRRGCSTWTSTATRCTTPPGTPRVRRRSPCRRTADADPAFSAAELDVVQEVWARVAEDYAPFSIDVTTEDPGTAGTRPYVGRGRCLRRRASRSPPTLSLRSTISGCGGGCAGVAYVGTYDAVMTGYAEYYQPAFALATPSYSAADIAEIAAHEAGHTLGLRHDGEGSSAYYLDPDGTRIWSPVMGPAYTPLTQFSIGDYPGATQTQDDYEVIGQHGPNARRRRLRQRHASTSYPIGGAPVSLTGLIGTRIGRRQSSAHPVVQRPALRHGLAGRPRRGPRLPAAAARLLRRGAGGLLARHRAGRYVVTGRHRPRRRAVGVPRRGHLLPRGRRCRPRRRDPWATATTAAPAGTALAVSGCAAPPPPPRPASPVVVAADADANAHGLRLVWDAPAASGGSPVTSYVVTVNGANPVTLPATARGYTFFNLLPQTVLHARRLGRERRRLEPRRHTCRHHGDVQRVAATPTADPSAGPTSSPSYAPTSGPTAAPSTGVPSAPPDQHPDDAAGHADVGADRPAVRTRCRRLRCWRR